MRKYRFFFVSVTYISVCIVFLFYLTLLNDDYSPRWATTTSGIAIVDVSSFYNRDSESFDIGISYGTDIKTFLSVLPIDSWHSEWIEKNEDYNEYQDYTGEIEIAGRYNIEGYKAIMCYYFVLGRLARQEYILTFEDVDGDIRKAFDVIFSSLGSALEGLEYQQNSDFNEKIHDGIRSFFSFGVKPFSGFSAVWNSDNNENPTHLWLTARDAKANESFISIAIGQRDDLLDAPIP